MVGHRNTLNKGKVQSQTRLCWWPKWEEARTHKTLTDHALIKSFLVDFFFDALAFISAGEVSKELLLFVNKSLCECVRACMRGVVVGGSQTKWRRRKRRRYKDGER